MTIIPMRDMKNTVEIEKRCAEANGPVFVTKNGYGKLVVMDIEYYIDLSVLSVVHNSIHFEAEYPPFLQHHFRFQ